MNFTLNRASHRLTRQPTPTSTASAATGSHSSPDDNWEDLDLSSTEYARRRKELMQLISDLRSMGAQTLIDIPSIVVIGGQSAGKSSLVEAVSGVNVPEIAGLARGVLWNVQCLAVRPLGPASTDQQKEVDFGPIITDKNDVDVWLRRAQAAILNPDVSPTSFYGRSIQDLKNLTSINSLKFSRNVVSIFIEDPGATDLSFVDLPGLIQNEDTGVVDLVRQLTESYISRPNTIILTTIPMSDDMQNQLSVKLAREVDPAGERTIGILTKPDTLGEGAINQKRLWVDVIEGRQHKLRHGYYCVRLPDDAQRAQRLSRSELQRIATDYFDTTSPWSEVTDRGRFGIPAFVSDISVLLVHHINRVLPQLRQDVERLLTSCLDEIRTLPKPLEVDPQIEVLARVNAFCDAFKNVVSGASSDKSLAQRNRALYTIFARSVRGAYPDFHPFENPMEHVLMDALDPEEAAVDASEEVETMGVYEVRKIIKESIAWELPGNVPYEAQTRLIRQFTVLWSPPAETCLASINDVLDNVIQQLVKTHFGRFKVLHDLISDLIRPDVEEHKTRAFSAMKETLELETSPSYAQNEIDYLNLREEWLAKYRYARKDPEQYRISMCEEATSEDGTEYSIYDGGVEDTVPPVQRALQYLAQAGYADLDVDDLARLSPRDKQVDDELIAMADVRAYFTIACKRIVDHIPLKIEHSLHHALAESLSVGLLQQLLAGMASTGNFADRMKELVAEDPVIERKRTHLEAMRTRLQEMRRKLVNFAA